MSYWSTLRYVDLAGSQICAFKHYGLAGVDDLEAVLGDLTAFVAEDIVPVDAVVVDGPTTTP